MATLENRIEKRVLKRIAQGIEGEINDLLSMGVNWTDQSMTSLGYVEWQKYFLGKKNKEEVISDWIRNEKNYVKKQIAWFRREKEIFWVDISDLNFRENVENLVQKWYKQGNDET